MIDITYFLFLFLFNASTASVTVTERAASAAAAAAMEKVINEWGKTTTPLNNQSTLRGEATNTFCVVATAAASAADEEGAFGGFCHFSSVRQLVVFAQ